MGNTTCSGSVSGAHQPDRHGICSWCDQQVASPMPAPTKYPTSKLTLAYGNYYDPDFGVDAPDRIRRKRGAE